MADAAATHGTTTGSQAAGRQKVYQRFNLHHRIQHFFMALSFTMLVITGWPMRFPELQVSKLGAAMVGGATVIGVLHRVFGVMMVAVSIYHVLYLIFMFFRGHRSLAMLPTIRDAKEALGDMAYWLGFKNHRPRFGRYNWIEKFEYFAVIWGTMVMIITGIIIWFPTWVTNHVPTWIVSVSVILHGYEALLAGLAIFLWHFYWVHLHPDFYPMSMVWLTGELTEEEMEHHHPRELEALKARAAAEEGKGHE